MSLQQDSASRIRVLPEVLINQIAAGEVVERPSSLIKELVENSLDAGASRIEIRLSEGGLKKIQILDNGCGMSKEDLALCLTRHATSKIGSFSDLEAVGTFGFRGEALASIAAVSRIEIRSRQPEADVGYVVEADFGLLKAAPRPVGCPAGTSITVEDLFERLPARLKFMRSAGTESTHCSKILKEIAAANSQTQFFFLNEDKKVLEFVTSSRESRFKECFRPRWEPMQVLEQNDEARLEAFLSPPHLIQDRGELWCFINRRPVKNRALIAMVKQAYASTLGPHHDPSGAVFLDIRQDWVDVNVHPQKTEVRCFRQESLFPWVLSSIKKAIGQQRSALSIEMPARATLRPEGLPTTGGDPFTASPYIPQTLDIGEPVPSIPWAPLSVPVPQTLPLPARASQSVPTPTASPTTQTPVPQNSVPHPISQQHRYRFLAQIRASYLLCETEKGLLLIDQHALHEKVRTEELKKRFAAQNLQVQQLLIPKILPLPDDLLPVLEENAAGLAALGFEVELFGNAEACLRTRPDMVKEEDCPTVIEQMLREILAEHLKPAEILDRSLHRLLATMACHSAIRFNHHLTSQEAQALLDQLEGLELGWTCPHGRPILFELSYQQIEHHFERA
jgi:DNA mismatch repair protein MutL